MKPGLNLASRPFVNRVPHTLLLGGLTVAAAAIAAWNLALFFRARSEARAAEAEIAALDARQDVLERRTRELSARLADEDVVELRRQALVADAVLSQRAVSWTLLLERLEEVLPWDAALESIATVVRDGDVSMKLEFRARNQEFYLQFIDDLEASPCFSNVYPADDVRTTSGEFEVSLALSYDADCGTLAEPAKKGRRPMARAAQPARRSRG